MANMTHCRFENTYKDLSDCYDALEEKGFKGLSESEKTYAICLIKKCKEFDEYLEHAEKLENEP